MIVRPVCGILQFVVVMPGDIHLAADDGLDLVTLVLVAVLPGHLEELLYTVHIAMVGDGDGGHAQLGSTGKKLPHVGESVKYGVLCMDVKMYEGHMWRFEKQR